MGESPDQIMIEELAMLIDFMGAAQARSTLSSLEKLAVLVEIRQKFSDQAVELPIEQVNSRVNLVDFTKQISEEILAHCAESQTEQELEVARYLALEQLWIMTNVAHGPYDLIESMLFDASAETYNHPVIPSKALALVSYALQGTN